MPIEPQMSSLETKHKGLKRTWLIRFLVVLAAVAAGGCLVEETSNVTLIEATIGSLLIALLFAETTAIISHFMEKPSFILTTHLLSSLVSFANHNKAN